MNEQSQNVPATLAPDIPPVALESAAPVTVTPAPIASAPVTASPAPTPVSAAPIASAPVSVTPAPAAIEPDYRALYENIRRENEILRQNAETARRSPVQAVSGGGAVNVPNDDFIRGFDSDTW